MFDLMWADPQVTPRPADTTPRYGPSRPARAQPDHGPHVGRPQVAPRLRGGTGPAGPWTRGGHGARRPGSAVTGGPSATARCWPAGAATGGSAHMRTVIRMDRAGPDRARSFAGYLHTQSARPAPQPAPLEAPPQPGTDKLSLSLYSLL